MKLWLASYPRSGNHFIRTTLNDAFGIKSATVYLPEENNMLSQPELADRLGYAGPLENIENDSPGWTGIKTHDLPPDDATTIYVVRDGRAALVSYLHYLKAFTQEMPTIPSMIRGDYWPGSWSAHFKAWDPRNRPNTLLLRYEDMQADIEATCRSISSFLGVAPTGKVQNRLSEMRQIDSNLFRHGNNSRNIGEMAEFMDMFDEYHRPTMEECGYYS